MKETKKYVVAEYENDYQDIEKFDKLEDAKEFAWMYSDRQNVKPENISIWENVYDEEGNFISSDFICNAE